MSIGLIGRKVGMTSVFQDDGTMVPVTVIEAGPCHVVQVREGGVQLGFGARRKQRTSKAELGHAKKAGLETAPQVLRVAAEMVQTAGYNLLMLSNSFQDLLRRGIPLDKVAASLTQALDGPEALLSALRPVPDIVAAFSKRIAALGTPPPPPAPVAVDYLGLLEHARPRAGRSADPIGE